MSSRLIIKKIALRKWLRCVCFASCEVHWSALRGLVSLFWKWDAELRSCREQWYGASLDRQAVGMANLHLSLEGCGCHLAFWAFVLCENSKMRLPLSLFAPFQKGLKNVFDEAILAALEPPEPKKTRRCVLLWTSLHSPFCKSWCLMSY